MAAVGNDIVVTYVLAPPGKRPSAGPGLGYVDIFNSSGQLVQRLEHGSWLNVPWGVALAPLDFGRFSHHLLVGQFANAGTTEFAGVIAAFNLATGKFDGLLQDATGKPLAIQGIWSLKPGNVSPSSVDPDASPAAQIYFTAGPNGETAGLFGYLTAVPTELNPRKRPVSHIRAEPGGVHSTVKFAAFHLPFGFPVPAGQSISPKDVYFSRPPMFFACIRSVNKAHQSSREQKVSQLPTRR